MSFRQLKKKFSLTYAKQISCRIPLLVLSLRLLLAKLLSLKSMTLVFHATKFPVILRCKLTLILLVNAHSSYTPYKVKLIHSTYTQKKVKLILLFTIPLVQRKIRMMFSLSSAYTQ
jgi:hypothetical protein